MQSKKETGIRKTNMKLYPIYKMIGYDLMFLYAIQILFLMQVKGCSTSEAVLLGSFFALFSVVFTIPLNVVVTKIGKKNSMILGNIFNLIYILMLMVGDAYYIFVLGELFEAIGFALKGMTESAFLNESIPKAEKKSDIFTSIDSKGYSKYSYFNAIAMTLSGIFFDVNPYIPLICAAVCIIIAIMLCVNFTELDEINDIDEEEKNKNVGEIYNDLRHSLKFIFRSNRLRALLLMSAIIIGLIRLIGSFYPPMLESIECSATLIGIFSAIFELVKGFSSNKSNEFNKIFKNKSYTVIVLTITISMIISGAVLLFDLPYNIQLTIVVLSFALIYIAKGFYQVLRSRYLNNFSNSKILHNLYSVDTILENLSRMIMTFVGSLILMVEDVKYAIMILGIIFTIIAIFVSRYMKTRVGLKPEQYKSEDIRFEG
ncbi:MAG: MFS transporter [Clostridia bacterium]|nr:MFS transporter [Clostridia bacterium]